MKTGKILLAQDDYLANAIVQELSEYRPLLADLKDKFNALELGDFTGEVYKKIVAAGTAPIVLQFDKKLNAQLDLMKVTIKVLREKIFTDSRDTINAFTESYKNLNKFKPHRPDSRRAGLSLSLISYNNRLKSFEVSSADRETILENNCRIYATSDAEKDVLSRLQGLLSSYNDYVDLLAQYEVTNVNMMNISNLYNVLKMQGDSKVELVPGAVGWIANYQERARQYRG